jgi:hypothetical protein
LQILDQLSRLQKNLAVHAINISRGRSRGSAMRCAVADAGDCCFNTHELSPFGLMKSALLVMPRLRLCWPWLLATSPKTLECVSDNQHAMPAHDLGDARGIISHHAPPASGIVFPSGFEQCIVYLFSTCVSLRERVRGHGGIASAAPRFVSSASGRMTIPRLGARLWSVA